MWRKVTDRGHEKQRFSGAYTSLLTSVGSVVLAIGIASQGVGQNVPSAEDAQVEDSLVDSEAVVEGESERISDWALVGVVWSDAHLVRKLAQKGAAEADDSQRVEKMEALIEDSDQIIEILKEFGWRRLQTRQAALANAEAVPVEDESVPPPDAADDAALEPGPASPPGGLPRRVETESPPGLNDPGVDDELLPHALDFDLRRYRVDDYIDEVPAERRSLADTVEDAMEGALAAGIDNISGTYGVGRGAGRISQREVMTRSNTLPYSKDSIYDTDDYDPDVDYDVNKPLTEPIPSDTNPLIEFTEQGEQFVQDAAWVQFQFDTNQRTWQMLQAQPTEESLHRYLDAAVAQLQAHAQVGERLTDSERLAAILRVIGRTE